MVERKRYSGRLGRTSLAKLDGAEPLLKAVVRERIVKARSDVILQGDVPIVAHLLLEGHTYRYRLMSDGRRQITAVLMPGDVCDLEAVMQGRANYNVGAITTCILGEIPADRVADPTIFDLEMTRALWRRLLSDAAISREWLVGLGCNTALERVAHILCEFRVRLGRAGLMISNTLAIRLPQAILADILGLSIVHINRILRQLRISGLIEVLTGRIRIIDVPALELMAQFDPAYLHVT